MTRWACCGATACETAGDGLLRVDPLALPLDRLPGALDNDEDGTAFAGALATILREPPR